MSDASPPIRLVVDNLNNPALAQLDELLCGLCAVELKANAAMLDEHDAELSKVTAILDSLCLAGYLHHPEALDRMMESGAKPYHIHITRTRKQLDRSAKTIMVINLGQCRLHYYADDQGSRLSALSPGALPL